MTALIITDLILVRNDRHIPIGYATTRITGPLRPDGTVDYRLALDAMDFQDVTPANNAVIPLLHALGTGQQILGSARNRRAALRRLGMKPLPKRGAYFIPASTFYLSLHKLSVPEKRQSDWPPSLLASTPWSAAHHPRVARWLLRNRAALHWAMVASSRSRYAMPIALPGRLSNHLLMFSREPWLAYYRELAQAMAVRAMEYLGNKNLPAAERAILAIHRLARLEGQYPVLIDRLIALSSDVIATRCDQALANRGHLTARQACSYRKELHALPAFPSVATAINRGKRFFALDALTSFARGRHAVHGTSNWWNRLIPIDYAQIARSLNDWCDREVKAFRRPGYRQQAQAIAQIRHDFAQAETQSRFSPTARLTVLLASFFTAGDSELHRIFGRAAAERRCTLLAFALAAYHAAHGRYPTALGKLVPQIIKKLPTDPFTGKPLAYQSNGAGYIFTSIGPRRLHGQGRHPVTLRNHWPKKRATRAPRPAWPHPPAKHP